MITSLTGFWVILSFGSVLLHFSSPLTPLKLVLTCPLNLPPNPLFHSANSCPVQLNPLKPFFSTTNNTIIQYHHELALRRFKYRFFKSAESTESLMPGCPDILMARMALTALTALMALMALMARMPLIARIS